MPSYIENNMSPISNQLFIWYAKREDGTTVYEYDDEKKKYANDNIVADEKYLEHLDLMAELAQILKNRRIEKGYF